MRKRFYIAATVLLLVALLAGCGEAKEEPARGAWAQDVYTNAYLGVSVSLPEGWTAYSNEELAGFTGMDLDKEGFTISAGVTIIDMYMWDVATNNTVMVCIEKVREEDLLNMTAESYLTSEGDFFTSSGFTIGEYTTQLLGGQEFAALDVTGKVEDENVHQLYFVKIIDDYAFTVVVRTLDNTDVTPEDLLTCFSEAQ